MTGEQKLEAGAIRQLVTSKELNLKSQDFKNLSDGNVYKEFIKELNSIGEVWKEHPVIKGYYGSSLGRVKHVLKDGSFFVLGQTWHKRGTYRLRFSIPGRLLGKKQQSVRYYTNIFITECFYGIGDGLESDHISSVEYDNRAANLRWLTHEENIANENTKTKVCEGVNNYNQRIKEHVENGDEPNWKELCLYWLEKGYIPKDEFGRQYVHFFDD